MSPKWKKILRTSLILIASAALGTGYFIFASNESAKGRGDITCRSIGIIVKDSLNNRLIGSRDIMAILEEGPAVIGIPVDSIDVYALEQMFDGRGEVLKSEVYCRSTGELCIEIAQRYPAIRFMGAPVNCYCDGSGFIFPITNPADVPVVTGRIPLSLEEGFKGFPDDEKERMWLDGIIRLGKYIESHDYWHRQVGQIEVAENGDIVLYLRSGKEYFIFGDCSDIEKKFRKISMFYKNISSLEEAENYTCVNLKFKNQIVCR